MCWTVFSFCSTVYINENVPVIYIMSGKRCHYTVAYNSATCWPIFKILSPVDLAVNLTKDLSTSQIRLYTTLWCVCTQKPQVLKNIRRVTLASSDSLRKNPTELECGGVIGVQQVFSDCRYMPQLRRYSWTKLCQQIWAISRPKFTILSEHVEEVLLFNNFFPIVDTCLRSKDIAGQNCVMVPK